MTDWKQWQGRVVGDNLSLTEYLAGTARSGVFLSVTDSQKLAIKLVPAEGSSNARLDRWKLGEDLSQSHLLKIHQSGRTTLDGVDLLYLVMEYADENLSQVLTVRALTKDEVGEMLPPLLEALEFLHAKGFVHGGVKPGNIMAVGEQLKLASDDVMRAGEVVNSPGAYDAPEVKQGVSPASDVWSLGLTLVEVLTQQKPASVETALRCADTLGEPFRSIVQNCLKPEKNMRWSASDIRKQLGAPVSPVQTQRAAKAPVVSPSQAPTGSSSSAKRYVLPGAVIVALAAAILIPALSRKSEPEKPPVVTTAAAPETPAQEQVKSSAVPSDEKTPNSKTLLPSQEESPAAASTRTESGSLKSSRTSSEEVGKTSPAEDGVVNKVLPDIPQKALKTITGKVRVKVRVKVDRQGNVVDSEFASAGPSRYFANLAMEASRKWKFAPGDEDARAWNLQFEFRRSGAEALPSQIER